MVGDPEGTTYIRKSHHAPRYTLVPTSCTSRVVGDSERDPLHSELIHPVIGEAATAQHTITYQQSHIAQQPYRPIHPHHSAHSEFYKERASRPLRLSSPSKDLNTFRTVYLRVSSSNAVASSIQSDNFTSNDNHRLLPVGFSLSIIPVCQPLSG